jgi:hypothetical protein
VLLRVLALFFLEAKTKNAKTTPCTVEGPLIDKGFPNRVTTTFRAAITLTRRAKHWQDVMLIAIRPKTFVASARAAAGRVLCIPDR